MKIRRKTLIIFALALGATILFYEPLHGIAVQKILPWKEDSFKGKPLHELRNALAKEGRSLSPVGPSTIYSFSGKRLQPNEEAMSFQKGKRYRWFPIGSAVNVGFVVFEKDGEQERNIVEIFHAGYVDSL